MKKKTTKDKCTDSHTYGRKILYKDKKVEVVEITWPPGCESAFHDHGCSQGLVRVLSGSLYEKLYSKKTKQFMKRSRLNKGDFLQESPETIHAIGNVSKTKTAKTLHVYTPPINMKTYNNL